MSYCFLFPWYVGGADPLQWNFQWRECGEHRYHSITSMLRAMHEIMENKWLRFHWTFQTNLLPYIGMHSFTSRIKKKKSISITENNNSSFSKFKKKKRIDFGVVKALYMIGSNGRHLFVHVRHASYRSKRYSIVLYNITYSVWRYGYRNAIQAWLRL